MAKIYWISGAAAIAKVYTGTIAGSAANGQVYTVTMGINNTKSVSYTAGVSDTNTTIATALQALLAKSTYPEFAEVTWTNPSAGVILATAATAGMEFTIASSATGTGTFVSSVTTINSGPNDVNVASNWSLNRLPQAGDDLYIVNNSNSLLYNLSALSSIVLNSFTWDSTFTGQAGLPAFNANGYEEYRPINFQIQTPTETFLAGQGGGSPLIQRDNGSQNWTVQVNGTGSSNQQGRPALLLKGSGTNTLNVTSGSAGSAIDPGDTASWSAVNVGFQQSQKTDVTLYLGAGATVGTITQDGGTVYAFNSVTTWTQNAGKAFFYGTGALGTLTVGSDTTALFSYQSSGILSTLTINANGAVDFRQDPRSRTVTTATCYGPFYDSYKTVTFGGSGPYFPDGLPDGVLWGTGIHLART